MKTVLKVSGFHCPSCKMLIEDVCSDFSQITLCNVDVKAGKVVIEHKESLDLAKLKNEIESLGEYKVKL